MTTSSEGHGTANDAGVLVESTQQSVAQFALKNGWSVSAESSTALKAKVAEKLEQARRSQRDAERAVKHWTAVAGELG